MGYLQLKPLTEIQKAYLAGIVDGEGSFHIYAKSGRRRTVELTCKISITNTNPALANWLLEYVGGYLGWRIDARRASHRPTFQWTVSGHLAYELTEVLFPFLVIKKQQAMAFKEWREADLKYRMGRSGLPLRGPKPVALEHYALRLELRNRVHELNRGGGRWDRYKEVLCQEQTGEE